MKLFSLAILLLSCVCPSISSDREADAVVRSLYHEIVARRPLGIPKGADKSAIWPFLSRRLTEELDRAQACERDYMRQHPANHHKPDYGWIESGLFSGENEEALPSAATVGRTEPQKDGSFLVFVKLSYRAPEPDASTFSWQVAAKVISEGGKYRVDDVLLFKDESQEAAGQLSDSFAGCEGPRWIGTKAEGK